MSPTLYTLEQMIVVCLQVSKWGDLFEITLRVVDDIRFVMSHSVVAKYVTYDRHDISRTWMNILAFVQGMDPQKRETDSHIEEEDENMHLPFALAHSIDNIHSLLVDGAFSISSTETDVEPFSSTYAQEFDDQDILRPAKVGRLSQESSVNSVSGKSSMLDCATKVATEVKSDMFLVPTSASRFICECLRAIENWLGLDNTSSPFLSVLSPKTTNSGNNLFAMKRTLVKIKKGKYMLKSNNPPFSTSNQTSSSNFPGKQFSSLAHCEFRYGLNLENERRMEQDTGHASFDDNSVEREYMNEFEAFHALSLSDWPAISYDVSSQDISVHIPLHRLLSLVLQIALRRCYGESVSSHMTSASPDPLSVKYHDFFGHILGSCHPYGFSAFVMEHPLRIMVFCAEVHAGMWRRNGDAAIFSCELYRSVHWYVISSLLVLSLDKVIGPLHFSLSFGIFIICECTLFWFLGAGLNRV